MLNLFLGLSAVLAGSGCSIPGLNKLQPEPYLPPPPRALTALSTLSKPDTLAAIRAESLLVVASENMVQDSTGKIIGTRKKGTFPDRFGGSVVTAGSEQSSVSQEERMIKARDAYRNNLNSWIPWSDMDHTMILNQGWGHLRAVMRSGDEVTIRASVWPASVVVVPGTAKMIRLESGWIKLSRISPREITCGQTDLATGQAPTSTPTVADGTPAVRLVAFVEAAESKNKAAITASTELRGVANCYASAVWRDRVADFAFDSWLGADRAAKLGGPPLLSR